MLAVEVLLLNLEQELKHVIEQHRPLVYKYLVEALYVNDYFEVLAVLASAEKLLL